MDKNQNALPTLADMPAEQAADLAALQAGAAEQGAAILAAEEANAPPAVDLAGEISGLLLAFVAMAKPILPSLSRIYTEETAGAAGGAIASLCNKHGWMTGGLLDGYGEEVAAAVVLIPLTISTVQGVKADIAENNRREEFYRLKKQADLRQHMNIAHNLDGKTETVTNAEAQIEPEPELTKHQPNEVAIF